MPFGPSAFFVLFFALPALAAGESLTNRNVGQFGGARVQLPCSLPGAYGLCYIDTSSAYTITRERPVGARSLGPMPIHGIGWSQGCEAFAVDSLVVAGLEGQDTRVLWCPDFSQGFSPMVGIDFFWGRSFTWRFFHGQFVWRETNLGGPRGAVSRGGPNNGWMAIDAQWGGVSFRAGWDTGAPVTLVDHSFVAAHPRLFRPSEIPISESMQARGGVAWRVEEPIFVAGVALEHGFVHAVDLAKFFGPSMLAMPVILGVNHLRQADWSFNLERGQFQVQAAPAPPTALPKASAPPPAPATAKNQ